MRPDKPMKRKTIRVACRSAGRRAGINKQASHHVYRHYAGFRTIPGEVGFGPMGGSLTNIFPA
jgi:hypothetical protein